MGETGSQKGLKLGISLVSRQLGSDNTPVSGLGSGKIVSIEGRSCLGEQNSLGVFQNGIFLFPLLEA